MRRLLLVLMTIITAACSNNPVPPVQPTFDGSQRLCEPAVPIEPARLRALQRPYEKLGQWYYPIQDPRGFVEEGEASWYGKNLNGKLTASGEVSDKTHMTAAHPALPMNTCVKVTNMENGSWVVLRINDRGPFTNMRVIDVSEAAAKYLGFFRRGIARVRVEALP